MNNLYEQEIHYRLLKLVGKDRRFTQRDMAKEMGISLGKVNYCLSELAKKGLIKITRFKSAKNKVPYTYILTPKGMKEKAELTVEFLKIKISEYNEIRRQIKELSAEIEEDELMGASATETVNVISRLS
ncbi:MAG: MarR family EPS-associated transcriptional regulator [Pseudomonadota bacterium]